MEPQNNQIEQNNANQQSFFTSTHLLNFKKTNKTVGFFLCFLSFMFLMVVMIDDSDNASPLIQLIQGLLAFSPIAISVSILMSLFLKNQERAFYFSLVPYIYPILWVFLFLGDSYKSIIITLLYILIFTFFVLIIFCPFKLIEILNNEKDSMKMALSLATNPEERSTIWVAFNNRVSLYVFAISFIVLIPLIPFADFLSKGNLAPVMVIIFLVPLVFLFRFLSVHLKSSRISLIFSFYPYLVLILLFASFIFPVTENDHVWKEYTILNYNVAYPVAPVYKRFLTSMKFDVSSTTSLLISTSIDMSLSYDKNINTSYAVSKYYLSKGTIDEVSFLNQILLKLSESYGFTVSTSSFVTILGNNSLDFVSSADNLRVVRGRIVSADESVYVLMSICNNCDNKKYEIFIDSFKIK